jgi:hypothetical protein
MAAFAGAMLLGAVPTILAYPNFKADPNKYSSGLAGVSQNLKARLVVVDGEFPTALLAHLVEGAQVVRTGSLSSSSTVVQLADHRHSRDGLAFIQHSAALHIDR